MARHVLALGSASGPFAEALGRCLRLRVENLSAEQTAVLSPEGLIHALNSPDVAIALLSRGHVDTPDSLERVLLASTTPVLLMPETAAEHPRDLAKLLVPLDGSEEAATAVLDFVTTLAGTGVEVLVLHVFDARNVPAFWDQPAHAWRSWEEEFLRRNLEVPGSRLELRSGIASESIDDVAYGESVDLVALGWSQHGSPERAPTVRAALRSCRVPLLLFPIKNGPVGGAR
jgi:nucleotide-binding universal stress UspA family protein